MTRALRAAILIACALAAWQALFWFAGPGALTSPLDTIAYTAQLLSSPTFYPHLIETAARPSRSRSRLRSWPASDRLHARPLSLRG
jgi:ABC-type nitrate/sulfonate/bicarbonate transport system permease component